MHGHGTRRKLERILGTVVSNVPSERFAKLSFISHASIQLIVGDLF